VKGKNHIQSIFFNPDEVRAIGLGLGRVIDDLNSMKRGELLDVPWTPEARKIQKEISAATRSAAAKLEKFTGIKCELPPYIDGDEDEFLTKES
jgi:hypothetical protein